MGHLAKSSSAGTSFDFLVRPYGKVRTRSRIGHTPRQYHTQPPVPDLAQYARRPVPAPREAERRSLIRTSRLHRGWLSVSPGSTISRVSTGQRVRSAQHSTRYLRYEPVLSAPLELVLVVPRALC
eukprot:436750-Rhodomonas_salina.1